MLQATRPVKGSTRRTKAMCKFIEASMVMPGIGCCRCSVYNGLQRKACKSCKTEFCEVEIPDRVQRCPTCTFGWPRSFRLPMDRCPSCKADGVHTFICPECFKDFKTLIQARMCCDNPPDGEAPADMLKRLIGPELAAI